MCAVQQLQHNSCMIYHKLCLFVYKKCDANVTYARHNNLKNLFCKLKPLCRPYNEIHFEMAFTGWKILRSAAFWGKNIQRILVNTLKDV